MTNRRKLATVLTTAALLTTGTLATAGTATATTTDGPQGPPICRGYVAMTDTHIRTVPSTTGTSLGTQKKGTNVCGSSPIVGDKYTACKQTSHQWIKVYRNSKLYGYVAAACMANMPES
ncbi:hypothetical protein MTQ01_09415 [Streptomyces sp. XM4193]|uniref:hypothetical protein n=1 Tax=Streptomyces sp. XM4193 TaxID=2929782 RepID=UPI001FF74E06|nr:hypothetical protein [Streptomyces sp. XM4193]MCK1796216.1 hypothetical protein [Streptomyces sp. XM4193]